MSDTHKEQESSIETQSDSSVRLFGKTFPELFDLASESEVKCFMIPMVICLAWCVTCFSTIINSIPSNMRMMSFLIFEITYSRCIIKCPVQIVLQCLLYTIDAWLLCLTLLCLFQNKLLLFGCLSVVVLILIIVIAVVIYKNLAPTS